MKEVMVVVAKATVKVLAEAVVTGLAVNSAAKAIAGIVKETTTA